MEKHARVVLLGQAGCPTVTYRWVPGRGSGHAGGRRSQARSGFSGLLLRVIPPPPQPSTSLPKATRRSRRASGRLRRPGRQRKPAPSRSDAPAGLLERWAQHRRSVRKCRALAWRKKPGCKNRRDEAAAPQAFRCSRSWVPDPVPPSHFAYDAEKVSSASPVAAVMAARRPRAPKATR